jgi:hypothetical protein
VASLSGWNALIFETRTGWIIDNALPVLGVPQFTRRINSSSSLEATVSVGDSSTPNARTLESHTAEMRYSLAVAYNGYVVAFGPIMGSDYTDSSGQLRISCGDMWSLLNRRLLINPATPPANTTASALLPMDSTRDVVYTGLSKSDIAIRLVSDSCSRTNFDLPIDFPATTGGTEPTRTYPVYDLATVGERLMDLSKESGGPDIDWQVNPSSTQDGYVRIQMRVGNPNLSQSGAAPIFDYGSSISSIDVSSDGSGLSMGDYVKGNATERASQVAYASTSTLTAAGWPALESVDTSYSSVTDANLIQGYAAANIAMDQLVTKVWSCTALLAPGAPLLSDYQPGTSAQINVRGHRYIADGLYSQRVLGVQNDSNNVGTVKLILQAVQVSP